jgi:adenine-specific DNA-methyltransferase
MPPLLPVAPDDLRTPGVVYTPEWLAAFVVDRVLDGASFPKQARWLDPACGDGVFLVEVVRRIAKQAGADDLPRLAEACVFGVDIDASACRRAREAVVSSIESVSGPQPTGFFASNVRCTDFLELDAGTNRRADLIVGNPPYVSAVSLSAHDKARFRNRFETAWGRLDLYALFIEQGLRFLAPRGRLGYITPDKWLSADSSRRLRAFIARNYKVSTIDRFDRHDLFPGVATVPCVTVLGDLRSDVPASSCHWWDVPRRGTPIPRQQGARVTISLDGTPWQAASPESTTTTSVTLADLVERISVGVATGLNRCFVLGTKQAMGIETELLRPVARGRDVRKSGVTNAGLWLLLPYTFDAHGDSPRLVDLANFPAAREYLEFHRADLERRHCVRVWGKAWYDLHDPVTCDLSRRAKILLPDIALTPRFALDPGRLMPLHSAYYLLLRPTLGLDANRLVAFLNSPDVAADLRRRAPTAKSGYRRFRTAVLRDVQVPSSAI